MKYIKIFEDLEFSNNDSRGKILNNFNELNDELEDIKDIFLELSDDKSSIDIRFGYCLCEPHNEDFFIFPYINEPKETLYSYIKNKSYEDNLIDENYNISFAVEIRSKHQQQIEIPCVVMGSEYEKRTNFTPLSNNDIDVFIKIFKPLKSIKARLQLKKYTIYERVTNYGVYILIGRK